MAREHFFNRIPVEPLISELNGQSQIHHYRRIASEQVENICQEYSRNSVISSGTAVAISALIHFGSSHLLRNDPKNPILNLSPSLYLVRYFLSASAISYGMARLKELASQGYYFLHPPLLPEADLVTQYGSKKHLLASSMQAYIEKELFYAYWQHGSPEAYQRLRKMLDKVLRLPLIELVQTYSKERVEAALKNFPERVVERLDRFARAEIMRLKMSPRPQSRYVIYFQGRPGTGKTFAAYKLAEAMGAKCIKVNLDGASIEDITGTPFENSDSRAGRLLDAIVSSTTSSNDINYKNQILLIDEFDRLLTANDKRSQEVLSYMLKLLDPTIRSFYSPYLKADIELPETIILAGNADIKKLAEEKPELDALVSRIDTCHFPGFDSKAKINIAHQCIIPKLEKSYSSLQSNMSGFKLSPEDLEKVDDFINKNESDKGLRSLEKFINELFEMNLH